MITVEQIQSAIEEATNYYTWPLYRPVTIEVNGQEYPVEIVDTYEGEYDYTEALWQVIRVDGRLFKKDGQYRSHEGSDWSVGSLYEVEGVEKVVKVWERT